jgi:putative PIN family toxin of toxin-antitoxin system
MLDELDSVLKRSKFAARLAAGGVDPSTLILGYTALSHVIKAPQPIPPICRDPSDDEVLACAQTALADLIVTGDSDLLAIGRFKSIRIVNSADGVALILKGTP